MSKVIQIDDFDSGFYTIPTAQKQDVKLQEVIDAVECEYLPKLFGVELSDLFLADLNAQGIPQTQRFIDVYDKFSLQPDDCIVARIYQSQGLKKLLKGLVYFLYSRDMPTQLTDNGARFVISENSERPRAIVHDIFSRWNNSIDYWCAIQWRMKEYEPLVYPEYKGLPEDFAIRF